MRQISLCLTMMLAATLGTPVHAGILGKALFDKECAACHGINGDGKTVLGKRLQPYPARDLRPKILSVQEIRSVLEQGREKSGMHGREQSLKPEQINVLIGYVLSLPFQARPEHGKRRFQQLCAHCHGIEGHGSTVVGSPNLVLSELSDIQMGRVIRNGHRGTIMGGMKHELSNTDIANIIVWLRLQRYGLQH